MQQTLKCKLVNGIVKSMTTIIDIKRFVLRNKEDGRVNFKPFFTNPRIYFNNDIDIRIALTYSYIM